MTETVAMKQTLTLTKPSPLVAAEVWSRSGIEHDWELMSGFFGVHDQLREVTPEVPRNVISAINDSRTAVIVPNAFQSDSPHNELARQAGAVAALGIPVYTREGLTSVLLLLLSNDDQCRGAFEIWERAERDELGLAAGHHVSMEHFARISPYVKFPHGSGLPGKVWDKQFPSMLSNLGASAKFARALEEREGEHFDGIGLPIMVSEYELSSLVLLLSSELSPIARAFEAWAIDTSDEQVCMRLESYLYPSHGAPLREANQQAYFCPDEGIVGKAWAGGMPIAVEHLEEIETQRAVAAKYCGLEGAIAFPICAGRNVRGVFVMYP